MHAPAGAGSLLNPCLQRNACRSRPLLSVRVVVVVRVLLVVARDALKRARVY